MIEGDEGAAKVDEAFVDGEAAIAEDEQAPGLVQPRQAAPYHPAVTAEPLRGLAPVWSIVILRGCRSDGIAAAAAAPL